VARCLHVGRQRTMQRAGQQADRFQLSDVMTADL
jgi:hypothetical protein